MNLVKILSDFLYTEKKDPGEICLLLFCNFFISCRSLSRINFLLAVYEQYIIFSQHVSQDGTQTK